MDQKQETPATEEEKEQQQDPSIGSVQICLDFEIDSDGQDDLKKCGFYINAKGICLSTQNDERPTQFATFEEFEAFGALIEKYIFHLLRNQYQLIDVVLQSLEHNKKSSKKNAKKKSTVMVKLYDPKIEESKIAPCTVFMSSDYQSNANLLLLIPGSGSVRSGQWSRAVCINDSLAAGSMLPYVSRAIDDKKWSVFLCDPNGRLANGKREFLDNHLLFIYDSYIKPNLCKSQSDHNAAGIRNIYIVAHSAAGIAVKRLLHERESVLPFIAAIAGTDSDFGRGKKENVKQVLKEKVINFRCSYKPKGTVLTEEDEFPKRVSCGHHEHVYSSAAAFDSVFHFFDRICPQKTTL